jgi:hypothetical protein
MVRRRPGSLYSIGVFQRLWYCPRSLLCVLASVLALALVCIELLLDGRLTFYRSACKVCGELCIAVFADSRDWYIGPSPYDPQIALRHVYALPSLIDQHWAQLFGVISYFELSPEINFFFSFSIQPSIRCRMPPSSQFSRAFSSLSISALILAISPGEGIGGSRSVHY